MEIHFYNLFTNFEALARIYSDKKITYFNKNIFNSVQTNNEAGFAFARTSWFCHDPSKVRTSSGHFPDDGRKATTSSSQSDHVILAKRPRHPRKATTPSSQSDHVILAKRG
jgi:hypothetical protein